MKGIAASVVGLVMVVAVAQAQMYSPDYGTLGAPMSSFLANSYLAQQVVNDTAFRSRLAAPGNAPVPDAGTLLAQPSAAPSTVPAQLAQAYPAARRAEVERLFTTLLATVYPKVEQLYGLPPGDVGGAVASLIATSYQAYRGVTLPDAQFRTLAAQVRGALASSAAMAHASGAQRRELYDQTATIAMFLLGVQQALQKSPNPAIAANMRQAGGEYLRGLLGVDPEAVQVGDHGMTIAPTPTARAPTTGSAASAAVGASDGIETVGFYTKVGMGYGGMLTFNPTPIVLFRSGEALKDMEALKAPAGLPAHRAAHPDEWTHWRRAADAIEIQGSKGWERITYTKTMDRLPRGFALVGHYQRLSGAGNLAVGGTSAVVTWSDLSFDRAGNFVSGGGAGASSSFEGAGTAASVVTSGHAPDQYGRYLIDGYTLTLNYADGRSERRMIVTDRADPHVIWVDGDGYTSRR